jgi:hypothetical protein
MKSGAATGLSPASQIRARWGPPVWTPAYSQAMKSQHVETRNHIIHNIDRKTAL